MKVLTSYADGRLDLEEVDTPKGAREIKMFSDNPEIEFLNPVVNAGGSLAYMTFAQELDKKIAGGKAYKLVGFGTEFFVVFFEKKCF